MTETVIVNRVPETAGLRHERLRLETEQRILSPVEVVAHAEDVVIDEVVEQAASELLVAPETTHSEAADLVSTALLMAAENRRSDYNVKFEEFRERVIAAFKHLGLDTRKHFGA